MEKNTLLYVIIALVFPPLAVYLVSEGNKNQILRTIIALVGTFFFALPGVIYALDIVLDKKWFYHKFDRE